MGIAAGLERYVLAGGTTLMLLIVLGLLRGLDVRDKGAQEQAERKGKKPGQGSKPSAG